MNSFPPSTRIPHPIQTQSTGSLTTNTSINDARHSPLSASTTTTSGPNSAVNNGNNCIIPPLPAISSQTAPSSLQPPSFANTDNTNNNNPGFHPFPDSPTTTNSFPPPPTTTTLRPGLFSNDAATQNNNDMSIGSSNNNGQNNMNFNGMNNNFNNGIMNNFNNGMNNMQNGILTTNNNPPTTYVNTYNPQMNMNMNMNTMNGMQQIPQAPTYNLVPMNNMNHMNNYNMNMMNNNMSQQPQITTYGINNNIPSTQTIIDDTTTQPMNGTVITNINPSNNAPNMNNNAQQTFSVNNNIGNGPFNDNGDKAKYIDDDLENGRKNYLQLLQSVNFRDENYQTCASKWIRTCIDKYQQNDDIYHNYLLNLVQSLINSIGDDKTVRGLRRTWMSYNNIENEWSFLHMICTKNLLYLFQSILGLLSTYKHELLVTMATINKDSKLRISPLYCCIVNGHYQFTKYLFEYYLNNLTSNEILHILQNGYPSDSSNSLIVQLMNYNHISTLQQIININASRTPQFLTHQQVQPL